MTSLGTTERVQVTIYPGQVTRIEWLQGEGMRMKNMLKRVRDLNGYSQQQVADALGVAVTTISR